MPAVHSGGASIVQFDGFGKGVAIILGILLCVSILVASLAYGASNRALGMAERAMDRAMDAERRAALAERRLERELGIGDQNE